GGARGWRSVLGGAAAPRRAAGAGASRRPRAPSEGSARVDRRHHPTGRRRPPRRGRRPALSAMFTGIVEALGRVTTVETGMSGGRRLAVAVPDEPGWRLALGESVA